MMIRLTMAGFFTLALVLLLLQVKVIDRRYQLPAWYKHDTIASAHPTDIMIKDGGSRRPRQDELTRLRTDYAHMWAHLDHLWSTGDVEAGKEYYTEDWFVALCTRNPRTFNTGVERKNLHHELHIIDWSADGLVCNLIDSNINMRYVYHLYPGRDSVVECKLHIAMALLVQGDHWRIDGMRYISSVITHPVSP